MEKKRFRCRCCGKQKLEKRKGQMYCGDERCQKVRKNVWRREKYAADLDYRLNQRESSRAWLESVGGAAKYFREYRRKQHRGESLFARYEVPIDTSANSDARQSDSLIKTGSYYIFPICGKTNANSDAMKVKIEVITDRYP